MNDSIRDYFLFFEVNMCDSKHSSSDKDTSFFIIYVFIELKYTNIQTYKLYKHFTFKSLSCVGLLQEPDT